MSLAQKINYALPVVNPAADALPVKGGRPLLTGCMVKQNGSWVPAQSIEHLTPKSSFYYLSEGDLVAKAAAAREVKLPKHDRATRLAALMRMRELWQESGNDPVDGVKYQEEMRAEWR